MDSPKIGWGLGGWPMFCFSLDNPESAAPCFAVFEAWAFVLPTSRDFPDPQLGFLVFVHCWRAKNDSKQQERRPPALRTIFAQCKLVRFGWVMFRSSRCPVPVFPR